jgi:hypothetical protein
MYFRFSWIQRSFFRRKSHGVINSSSFYSFCSHSLVLERDWKECIKLDLLHNVFQSSAIPFLSVRFEQVSVPLVHILLAHKICTILFYSHRSEHTASLHYHPLTAITSPGYNLTMSLKSILGAALLIAAQQADAIAVHTLATNLTIPKNYALAAYRLVDNFNSGNWYNSFDFYSGSDPTHGYVNYQTLGNSQNRGLVNTNNGQVYMGVDHTTVNPGSPGRASVRVSSKKSYTHGLFVADIQHMPGSACGVWPAFVSVHVNWMFRTLLTFPSSGSLVPTGQRPEKSMSSKVSILPVQTQLHFTRQQTAT